MATLCENAEEKQQGITRYLWCKQSNSICAFYRYCTNDRCLKMTEKYTQCKVRYKNG
jgi:hypothetical protein